MFEVPLCDAHANPWTLPTLISDNILSCLYRLEVYGFRPSCLAIHSLFCLHFSEDSLWSMHLAIVIHDTHP